ncbi:MAG: methyltransferase domain-containing protein, partial [Planctomycetota bacterium]|nr:methyltransferase domain-containing protein [Planctomycetota bacterium]
MKPAALDFLVCCDCGSPLGLRCDPLVANAEVLEAELVCATCRRAFLISKGVPRFSIVPEQLQSIAASFGFEWTGHAGNVFEKDTVFGRTREEELEWFLKGLDISPVQVAGSLVLDAGCGRGRLTSSIGALAPKGVFGVDISDAVLPAFTESVDLQNVHIVQGDVSHLPFLPGTFDYIYSSGVLHHTGDARAAFSRLAKLLHPGGKMFVWVYAKRFNPFRFVKSVFDVLGLHGLSHRRLFELCRLLASLSLFGLRAYQIVRAIPPLRPRTFWGRNSVR